MLAETKTLTRITAYFFLLFADLISYFYLVLKIYRILCFSKLTFDQLPLINPYKWPFSFIRIITRPYFNFWSKLLPNLKFGSGSYDISAIIGLEMLSKLIYVILQIRALTLEKAQRLLLIK